MNEKIAVLWNPCVGKTVSISISFELHLRNRHTYIGFGVCPNTRDPKLVRINTIGFPIVCAWEGFIYWHAYYNIKFPLPSLIISFDLESHEFGEVSLPARRVLPSHLLPDTWGLRYRVLEFRKNGEVIIENTDDTISSAIEVYEPSLRHLNGIGFYGTFHSSVLEVYEPSSGRSSGLGINGSFGPFSVNSYMETLLLLDE
nr:hypothetical protein [Tanacetum cinerariifolium]